MSSQNEAAIVMLNTLTSKLAIAGWFAGLIYALWFSSNGLPPGVLKIGFVYGALLVVVGMFVASIVIGSGTALALGGVSKVLSGSITGRPGVYMLGLIIVPVLCFMAATGAVYKLATWDPFGFVKYSGPPLEVQCASPRITFTLGFNDKLDAGQQQALCSCLGTKLSADDQAILTGAVPEPSAKVMEQVSASFGGAMRQ